MITLFIRELFGKKGKHLIIKRKNFEDSKNNVAVIEDIELVESEMPFLGYALSKKKVKELINVLDDLVNDDNYESDNF